jgi:transposase
VIEGLRNNQSIADICRREGINQNLYYLWRKELLESGEFDLPLDIKERLLADEEISSLSQDRDWLIDSLTRSKKK